MRNIIVGIVCAVLLLAHLLVGLIAHKLDHIDSLRLSQVPLCGRPGLYHYRVLVKTGWRRGAGEPRKTRWKLTSYPGGDLKSMCCGGFIVCGLTDRHHSTRGHQSVWCQQERLPPSAEGRGFSAGESGPVSPGDGWQPGWNLENMGVARQYRYEITAENKKTVVFQ